MSTSDPSLCSAYEETEDEPAQSAAKEPNWWLRQVRLTLLYLKRIWFIVGRWQEEPIGVAVPLIAMLLILLSPQMPDMFAGMAGASMSGWAFFQSMLFAFSAFLLGVLSWYWTRAALGARCRTSDQQRHQPVKAAGARKVADPEDVAVKWAREKAPRVGLIFSMVIAATPFLIVGGRVLAAAINSEQHIRDINWMGTEVIYAIFSPYPTQEDLNWKGLFGLPAGVFIAIVSIYLFLRFIQRRKQWNLYSTKAPPLWMWRLTTTSTLAAAPFGWPVALALFACSWIWVAALAFLPVWVHDIYAPTAALFALAFLIAPLVITFALLRDLVAEVSERAVQLFRGWPATVLLTILSALFLIWLFDRPTWLTTLIPYGWLRWLILSAPALLLVVPTAVRLFGDLRKPLEPLPVRPKRVDKVSFAVGVTALLAILYGPAVTGWGRDHYAIRTTGTNADHPRDRLEDAVGKWAAVRVPDLPAGASLPVIIVATEGGASRAAVWTLAAMRKLDQVTEGKFGRYLFAISGVSGGSLGAVTYIHALKAHPLPSGGLDWEDEQVQNGMNELATADLLSATIATYFLNDTVLPLVAGPLEWLQLRIPDRAAALEAAFERHWSRHWLGDESGAAQMGLLQLHQGSPGLPHLLLNGTDVDTGRRVITSTIPFGEGDDLFSASDDFLEYVGRDIPASTAVTNSARFPYVSSAGRFWQSNQGHKETDPRQIVDGGYFENYGARTAVELARKIRRISVPNNGNKIGLVPIIVVISNDGDGLRSEAEKHDCEAEDADGRTGNRAPCLLLQEVTVSCELNAPTDKMTAHRVQAERAVAYRGVASEIAAPLLGLYATRAAHGQDAQHIVRRFHCPGPESDALYARDIALTTRMIHMAVPKANPNLGESAPLNWVLNENVRMFLLEHAPEVEFNRHQAELLKTSLDSLLRIPPQPRTQPEAALDALPTGAGGKDAALN